MAIAGYIPDQAIDLQRDEPTVVALSQAQRHRLRSSGEIKAGNQHTIWSFLKEYVFSKVDLVVDTDYLTTEEFLQTKDLERRQELGRDILGLLIGEAVEPFHEVYRQAWLQEALFPGIPSYAHRFVKKQLGEKKLRARVVNSLHSQLVVA